MPATALRHAPSSGCQGRVFNYELTCRNPRSRDLIQTRCPPRATGRRCREAFSHACRGSIAATLNQLPKHARTLRIDTERAWYGVRKLQSIIPAVLYYPGCKKKSVGVSTVWTPYCVDLGMKLDIGGQNPGVYHRLQDSTSSSQNSKSLPCWSQWRHSTIQANKKLC